MSGRGCSQKPVMSMCSPNMRGSAAATAGGGPPSPGVGRKGASMSPGGYGRKGSGTPTHRDKRRDGGGSPGGMHHKGGKGQPRSPAAAFVHGGWLYGGGMNRKLRRAILFSNSLTEVVEGVSRVWVGQHVPDGSVSEDAVATALKVPPPPPPLATPAPTPTSSTNSMGLTPTTNNSTSSPTQIFWGAAVREPTWATQMPEPEFTFTAAVPPPSPPGEPLLNLPPPTFDVLGPSPDQLVLSPLLATLNAMEFSTLSTTPTTNELSALPLSSRRQLCRASDDFAPRPLDPGLLQTFA
eukprot:TRINITY_DN2270_c1_g2_i1.p1 TRINITY_DN2270_c1_g2~~TRINITY_DN2270_c1_g2_i1.p1  ORF type:complete len:295 (+),score=31.78 TRINITY_DN2270_c1_g2_i1:68-952(+)